MKFTHCDYKYKSASTNATMTLNNCTDVLELTKTFLFTINLAETSTSYLKHLINIYLYYIELNGRKTRLSTPISPSRKYPKQSATSTETALPPLSEKNTAALLLNTEEKLKEATRLANNSTLTYTTSHKQCTLVKKSRKHLKIVELCDIINVVIIYTVRRSL